jgi:putative PLP-dependent aminotransferase (TIGR04422 family)
VKAKTFFLWPEPTRLSAADFLGSKCPYELIEAQIRELFPTAEPVLFSSARAGLTALLNVLELSRPSLVWVPPFSSHCVLDAVAHFATPVTLQPAKDPLAAALVYHQWGHVHTHDFSGGVRIIEDCVDTLLVPGSSPFAAGGEFALWSLPKVLGTLAGGVIFCRSPAAADELRRIRIARGESALQALLRAGAKVSQTASAYWNGAEALSGGLVEPLRRQIFRRIGELNRVVDERLNSLEVISVMLRLHCEKRGRLPSNLPMCIPTGWERVWGAGKLITSGLRSFNSNMRSPSVAWTKVAPLPVHLQMRSEDLLEIFSLAGVSSDWALQEPGSPR